MSHYKCGHTIPALAFRQQGATSLANHMHLMALDSDSPSIVYQDSLVIFKSTHFAQVSAEHVVMHYMEYVVSNTNRNPFRFFFSLKKKKNSCLIGEVTACV